jgi:glutathione synthase/RimK-type ligase-like ATP-grasp enzyme
MSMLRYERVNERLAFICVCSRLMIDCTLVTCEAVPDLDPDDRILMEELRARGLSVSIEVWSNQDVDWAESRMCLLRSTWDYHGRYDEFIAWLEHVASVTSVRNDRHLVRWNAHKSYIRKIELLDVPVVPTVFVRQGQRRNVWELADSRGWGDIVLKPARGAAARDVLHAPRKPWSLAGGQAHFDRLIETEDVLIQPYLASVAGYGERALIFFRGCYSHAVLKKPFDTILRVSDSRSARVEATGEELAVATKALTSVPGDPLYARIDLLRDDMAKVCVSEVELIEPGLYLGIHDTASATFADAIERELAATARAN